MIPNQCFTCRHYRAGMKTCAAFPKGIPEEIYGGDVSHRKPYPGDNGIRYDPGPESMKGARDGDDEEGIPDDVRRSFEGE